MHDIKLIRKDANFFEEQMQKRGVEAGISSKILNLDKLVREAKQEFEEVQSEAKKLAKEIGATKAKGENADELLEKSASLKTRLETLKKAGSAEDENYVELQNILASLPNILSEDVPEGADEEQNIELKKWGQPTQFSFTPKDHTELGELRDGVDEDGLAMLDFEKASKISGARFSILSGKLATLERALSNFMLDIHIQEFGYQEVSPPLLVRGDAMFGTSQLPKFREDAFETLDGFFLIPTGEVPLTNIVRESIIESENLPLKFCASTHCFRREAGSAGKDTKGIIRQHQFLKTEMVIITDEASAQKEHEALTAQAEYILEQLELPYRKMLLCSGDTGFGAKKTYDIEVFLPSQNKYREISSCSWFGDFQARRMNARHKERGQKQTEFLHTINGSGLAVGRTIIAILENFQQEDGSIKIPKNLQKYTGFDII